LLAEDRRTARNEKRTPRVELNLTTRTSAGATVLAAAGEIDIHTAPDLRARLGELEQSGARTIVVDLSGVDFLDSSALGTLVGANKELQANGGALRLVCTKPSILRVFEITRLSEVIPVFDSVERACA
jgi:anti-sigma B factor antagonist